jgi:hypothetical protein
MKARRVMANDMRPEYDFASMKGGVRGKYASRYRAGTNLVLLDPEVAQAFPTDAAVNSALRAVLNMTTLVGSTRSRSAKRQRTSRRDRVPRQPTTHRRASLDP